MISVCIATYNGEKYLAEQLDSILLQVSEEDELIISYNISTDNTLEIIKTYAKNDPRIKVILCEERGVIPNFTNAIVHCSGNIICLADQDDIWEDNKIEVIKKTFKNNNIQLILHNCSYIGKNGEFINGDLFSFRHAKTGIMKNLVRNCYQGCCMAFEKDLINIFLPIPKHSSMHDQWIGLCAEKKYNVYLLNDKLIKYRRHDNNTSGEKIPLYLKLKTIVYVYIQLIVRVKENRRMKDSCQ